MTKAQKPAKAPAAEKPVVKVVCDNRRARHEYEVFDVFQAGIELAGTEVKSMRQGKANLQDSFAKVEAGQLWLYNCHVSPYDFGNRFNHDPVRRRRLLMHKAEIRKLGQQIKEKGLTLIPLKMYFLRNRVKVDVALARGKHLYDKREAVGRRESKRQLERLLKQAR